MYYKYLFRDNNFVPKKDIQQNEVFISQKKLNDSDSARLICSTNKKELITVIKNLKNVKAPGLDRVSNEMIKASFEILKEAYIKLFNFVMTLGIVPSIWCKGLISPIHKSGDPLNPESYRPICVLSCICKFFCNLLNTRLTGSLNKNNIIHKTQVGFVENHRTSDHAFTLKSAIAKHANATSRGRIYGCFVDFKKAYDSVWHKGLFTKLENLNVNSVFINIIPNLFVQSK